MYVLSNVYVIQCIQSRIDEPALVTAREGDRDFPWKKFHYTTITAF